MPRYATPYNSHPGGIILAGAEMTGRAISDAGDAIAGAVTKYVDTRAAGRQADALRRQVGGGFASLLHSGDAPPGTVTSGGSSFAPGAAPNEYEQAEHLAKASDSFRKAVAAGTLTMPGQEPRVMGYTDQEWKALGHRDRASVGTAFLQAQANQLAEAKLSEYAQMQQARGQEMRLRAAASQQEQQAEGDFARFARLQAMLPPDANDPGRNTRESLAIHPGAVNARGFSQFLNALEGQQADPFKAQRLELDRRGLENQGRALDYQKERIDLERNPPPRPIEAPRVNIVRDPLTQEDRVSVTLGLDQAREMGFSVPGLPNGSRPAAAQASGAGTKENPIPTATEADYKAVPKGKFYRHPDGSIRQKK